MYSKKKLCYNHSPSLCWVTAACRSQGPSTRFTLPPNARCRVPLRVDARAHPGWDALFTQLCWLIGAWARSSHCLADVCGYAAGYTIKAATACHMAGVHATSCAFFAVMDIFVVQVLICGAQSATFAMWLSTEGRLGHLLDFFFFCSVPGPPLFLLLGSSNLQHTVVQLAWPGHSGLRERHRRHTCLPASLTPAEFLRCCACDALPSACTATDLSAFLH